MPSVTEAIKNTKKASVELQFSPTTHFKISGSGTPAKDSLGYKSEEIRVMLINVLGQ